jgi:hypothetical protein
MIAETERWPRDPAGLLLTIGDLENPGETMSHRLTGVY